MSSSAPWSARAETPRRRYRVDEEAGHAVVGEAVDLRLVLFAVFDVRQLRGCPELAPPDGNVAVEDERRVGAALADESLLEGPVGLVRALLLGVHGVEPGAPAAAPHAVVALGEVCERVPCLRRQRPNGERLGRVLGGQGMSQYRRSASRRPQAGETPICGSLRADRRLRAGLGEALADRLHLRQRLLLLLEIVVRSLATFVSPIASAIVIRPS